MELTESYKTFHNTEEVTDANNSKFCFCWKQFFSWKRQIILIFAPIFLSPLTFFGQEGKCGFVILLMACYWLSDATHMSTVAFLPILLYPMLGIVKASSISKVYFDDINALFLCGLMVAVAIESCNLHKRIALKVILLIGTEPSRLMIGFMLTTAFISMWMNNTATTAMMVPIAEAVIVELEKEFTDISNAEGGSIQPEDPLLRQSNSQCKKIFSGIFLSISFAANIGGTMTLTGTGTNIIFAGQLQTLFGNEASISFMSWFVFAFPLGILILISGWICLNLLFIDGNIMRLCCLCCNRSRGKKSGYDIVLREYEKLGKMSFAEKSVLIHFVLLALLWLSRDPKFISGWSVAFRKNFVSDATSGMLIVILLFVFPSEKPKIFCWNTTNEVTSPPSSLLTWDMISKKFPWHLIVLLGGGLAMAEGAKESGLSVYLGCRLALLSNVPSYVLVFILCLLVSTLTEFSSNTGTVTIFLPVVATLSQSINLHPYYLMIPTTICSSFAFMLPVATPPNAIVFSTNRVTVKEMFKSGVVMDIMGIILITIAINTYGKAYFHLHDFPRWAQLTGNFTHCS